MIFNNKTKIQRDKKKSLYDNNIFEAQVALNSININRELLSQKQRTSLAILLRDLIAFDLYVNQAIKIKSSKRSNIANHLLRTETIPVSRQINQILDSFSEEQSTQFLADVEFATFFSTITIMSIIFLILFMSAIAWLFSVNSAKRISQPVVALAEATHALADGNLFEDLPVTGNDELSQLTYSFNEMRAKLEYTDNEKIRYVKYLEDSQAKIKEQTTSLKIRNQELKVAQQEAQRASQVKSEFLANMSHELRTPMNSIIGFTQRLLKKLGDSLSPRHFDALQTISRNARHLLALINDILDLSKIEAGRMELKKTKFDIVELICNAYEQNLVLTDNKPVELELNLPQKEIILEADQVRVLQVITNLISNGIKFTEKGSVTVSVSTEQDTEKNTFAKIQVKDTGRGIKENELKQLFKKFSQLEEKGGVRRVGGTGLGLFISAQFIKMHGGDIEVESQYGKGSVFTITIPNAEVCQHLVTQNSSEM